MGVADAVNIIARFIACEDISDLSLIKPVDCIALCISSVLYSCETVFDIVQARPEITKTLVLCGRIGHSTELIYNAVAQHPRFREIAAEVRGLPEAQVLHTIFMRFYASQFLKHPTPLILLEERSITCATNAIETRRLLESHEVRKPESMVIIQDPTMVQRTLECFKKVYEDAPQVQPFEGCPVFVPLVSSDSNCQLVFTAPNIAQEAMWPMNRYLDLVMGEIPRLRNHKNGYGPRGKDFIPHVSIPTEVEQSYRRLFDAIPNRR